MEERQMPREKALMYGIESLDNTELLSLILKSAYKDKNVFSLADELIQTAGGFKKLLTLTYDELVTIKGIKKAKAMEILAILEVAKRLTTIESVNEQEKKLEIITLIDHIRVKIGFCEREQFYAMFINSAGKIIKSEIMYKGTSNKSLVGIDEVLRKALLSKTRYIVVAHNHPSDDCSPSSEDISLTDLMEKGCKQVGLTLLDHIIVSRSSYFSFKKHGMLLK